MIEMEVLNGSRQPIITLDESLRHIPFEIQAHPSEFGRLARAVGIPEAEIGKIHVTLVDGRTIYPNLGSYNPETKAITIGIPSRRRNLPGLLNTSAHELDHYNYYLTHQYVPHVPTRREVIIRRMQEAALTIPYVNLYVGMYLMNKNMIDYYSAEEEVHARRTAREVVRQAEETGIPYNLLTVMDKPKMSRRQRRV